MAKGILSDVEPVIVIGVVIAVGYLAVKYLMPTALSGIANADMGGTDFGTDSTPGGSSSWTA